MQVRIDRLDELAQLAAFDRRRSAAVAAARSRWRREVLAYFVCRLTNARTEGINRLSKQVKRSACGFRNITNYIARALLETGGFRPRLHPHSG